MVLAWLWSNPSSYTAWQNTLGPKEDGALMLLDPLLATRAARRIAGGRHRERHVGHLHAIVSH